MRKWDSCAVCFCLKIKHMFLPPVSKTRRPNTTQYFAGKSPFRGGICYCLKILWYVNNVSVWPETWHLLQGCSGFGSHLVMHKEWHETHMIHAVPVAGHLHVSVGKMNLSRFVIHFLWLTVTARNCIRVPRKALDWRRNRCFLTIKTPLKIFGRTAKKNVLIRNDKI